MPDSIYKICLLIQEEGSGGSDYFLWPTTENNLIQIHYNVSCTSHKSNKKISNVALSWYLHHFFVLRTCQRNNNLLQVTLTQQ